MAIKAQAKGGIDFEPLAEGTHFAVCDMIVDLGMQPGSQLFPKPRHQIYFRWQVPGERIDVNGESKPRVVGGTYTASMNEKANLRKVVEGWRGTKFKSDQESEQYDLISLLGKPCMVTVVHSKDGKYANVASVAALPKGTPAPKLEGEAIQHDTDVDSYAKLPKWLQTKLDGQIAEEDATPPSVHKDRVPDAEADRLGADDLGDDIPF